MSARFFGKPRTRMTRAVPRPLSDDPRRDADRAFATAEAAQTLAAVAAARGDGELADACWRGASRARREGILALVALIERSNQTEGN